MKIRRPKATVAIGERQDGVVPGWWCDAQVGATKYRVGVLTIPTDTSRPDIWGVVRDATGKVLWQDRVVGSVTPRELLRLAQILRG